MGKLQVFEVVFGGGKDLFVGGEWIQGHVRIVLSEAKSDIRGIQVKFEGEGKTHWTESESTGSGKNRHTRSVSYWLKEHYFKEKMLILGKDKSDGSGDKVHLEAGEHHFPFRFQVPTTPLPHAFEGRYGWIRYKVHAKIDRPWRFNHNTVKMFSIIGTTLDLNTVANAPMPSQSEGEKTVCCLCCASGPIKASARIDKSGYVPGETIWVSGYVENNSRREICDLTAQLVQITHFRARRHGSGREHHRQQCNVLGVQKSPGCGEYRTASMDRTPILVPAAPPSQLPGCDIMRIEYFVKFATDVSGTPFDLNVMLPITIGTVPLQSAYQSAVFPQGVVTQQPTAPPAELPPPTYEEAMGGPQEIPSKDGYDYTFGKLMYAPRYPYYSFPDAGNPAYPPPAGSMYPPPQ